MGTRVVGYKQLFDKLRRLSFEAPVATAFGAYEGMQNMMVEAKENAPKDTHAMANSGYVAPPEVRAGADVIVDAGFGGRSEEYVVRVHEAHPTQPFFFVRALDAHHKKIQEAIARHVTAYLQTGKTSPVPKIVPAHPMENGPIGDDD